MAIWFRKWSAFDSARSLGEWIWYGVCWAFGLTGAGVTAWLSAYWDAYWQTFSYAGYPLAFMVAIIVIPSGLILLAKAADQLAALKQRNHDRADTPSGVPKQAISAATLQPPARYLEAAIVIDGIGTAQDMRYPEYRARFARNGRAATFYIEHSMHFPGSGPASGWSKPKKIEALYRDRFASGQEVNFPLVSPCMTDHGTRWHFGLPREADGVEKPHIGQGLHYRGRVTMLADDGTEQHCYFILSTNENANELPKVTGEHMFAHLSEWEGREPPGGNAQILFSKS